MDSKVSLRHKLIKFWSLLLQGKFIHLLILLSAYFPSKIWRFNVFYILILEKLNSNVKKSNIFQIHIADQKDLPCLCQIEDKFNTFQSRFNNRDLCFLAEIDGEPAGYAWMCIQDQYFDEVNNYIISIKNGVYYYDSLISSFHRNKGIWKYLMTNLVKTANDLGRPKIYCIVEYVNDLSLLVHRKFGFEVIERVLYFSFFGKDFHFKKTY